MQFRPHMANERALAQTVLLAQRQSLLWREDAGRWAANTIFTPVVITAAGFDAIVALRRTAYTVELCARRTLMRNRRSRAR